MKRSLDGIHVSHAGVLPRPANLQQLWLGGSDKQNEFDAALPGAVKEVVDHQIDIGISCVNDGEISKRGGFSGYIRDRMSGIEQGTWAAGEQPHRAPVNGRDRRDFPEFYATGRGATQQGANQQAGGGGGGGTFFVVDDVAYTGHDAIQADIDRLKAATAGRDVEAYLPAIAPGTMEHWLWNKHYPNDEAFLFAIADVLHEEYKQITDAGIILQVDDPDLPDGWQMFPEWSVADYRKYADLRVEAINHALRGIPEELVRLHICWGSQHGPHADDIPLEDFLDIVLKVKAECYSIEAANPQHEHEWTVFQKHPLPDGKSLMPGVVGHATDIIEHPELVAQRIIRYADVVGKENVIAGTDCGLASRVGSGDVCWGKLKALGEGARIASERLFG